MNPQRRSIDIADVALAVRGDGEHFVRRLVTAGAHGVERRRLHE